MKFKEKVLPILKKIGLAIVGFIGLILLSRFIKPNDKVKENVDEIKDAIDKAGTNSNNIKESIHDIEEVIEQKEEEKQEIVDASEKDRVKLANNAGFKKKNG
jgi:F0F1-type ATP synthase membrane subunit b/b'